jgi:iron complex transport system substrate-binding protein
MKKCRHRFFKLFFRGFLTLILITACYSKYPQKINSSHLKVATSECRIIQHQLGKTCLPLNSQRLIVTDEDTMEAALALGLKPLAAGEPNIGGIKRIHLTEKAEGIQSLGKQSQLNLERMIKLHPDLILGFEISPEDYQIFSQIAPTVSIEYVQAGWKDAFIRIGKILGKSEVASRAIADYQQRVDKLRNALGQKLEKTKVSVSQFYGERQNLPEFRSQFSFPGSILQDIGLALPDSQIQVTNPNQTFVSVSLEKVDLLDADILFIALDSSDTKAEESLRKYSSNPLWQQLSVFQNHQIYTVDGVHWIFGNILSANLVLDDLFKYLLDK